MLVTHDLACAARADTLITMHAGTIGSISRRHRRPQAASRELPAPQQAEPSPASSLDNTHSSAAAWGQEPGPEQPAQAHSLPADGAGGQPQHPVADSAHSQPNGTPASLSASQPSPPAADGAISIRPPRSSPPAAASLASTQGSSAPRQPLQGLLSRQLSAASQNFTGTSHPNSLPDSLLGSPELGDHLQDSLQRDAGFQQDASPSQDADLQQDDVGFKALQASTHQSEGPAERVLDLTPAAGPEEEEARCAGFSSTPLCSKYFLLSHVQVSCPGRVGQMC